MSFDLEISINMLMRLEDMWRKSERDRERGANGIEKGGVGRKSGRQELEKRQERERKNRKKERELGKKAN